MDWFDGFWLRRDLRILMHKVDLMALDITKLTADVAAQKNLAGDFVKAVMRSLAAVAAWMT